jgi:hypothetical protein
MVVGFAETIKETFGCKVCNHPNLLVLPTGFQQFDPHEPIIERSAASNPLFYAASQAHDLTPPARLARFSRKIEPTEGLRPEEIKFSLEQR